MWKDVLAAGVISLLAGMASQPPRRYEFWRRWVPKRFGIGVVVYLLIHTAMGVLVGLLAVRLDWKPVGGDWLWNGLIYAAAAQGVARIAPQSLADELISSQTILSRLIEFTVTTMNLACEAAINKDLDDLTDDQLAAEASYVFQRYIVDEEGPPDAAKKNILESLEAAIGKLHGASHLEGRAILERFLINQFLSRELLPEAIKK
jgi:hypothetical protein